MQPVGASFSTPGAKKRAILRGNLSCHVAHFHGYFTKRITHHYQSFFLVFINNVLLQVCVQCEDKMWLRNG